MKAVFTIMWKDFKGYFSGPSFYIVTGLFTMFLSFTYFTILEHFRGRSVWIMMQTQGQGGLNFHQEVVLAHISNLNLVMLFLTPFLTVKLLAEEKKLRTFDLLLTTPINATQIVLGKYLAGLGAVSVLLLISMLYPLATAPFTTMQWPLFITAYLSLFLLCAIYVAIGVFCSSTTDSVLVAGITSIILSLTLWFIGWSSVVTEDALLKTVLDYISVGQHFSSLLKGSLETSSLVFFLSVIAIYTFLTQRVVESARWR